MFKFTVSMPTDLEIVWYIVNRVRNYPDEWVAKTWNTFAATRCGFNHELRARFFAIYSQAEPEKFERDDREMTAMLRKHYRFLGTVTGRMSGTEPNPGPHLGKRDF